MSIAKAIAASYHPPPENWLFDAMKQLDYGMRPEPLPRCPFDLPAGEHLRKLAESHRRGEDMSSTDATMLRNASDYAGKLREHESLAAARLLSLFGLWRTAIATWPDDSAAIFGKFLAQQWNVHLDAPPDLAEARKLSRRIAAEAVAPHMPDLAYNERRLAW